MSAYDKLQPRSVWRVFAELARVPRCSGHEQAVTAMLKSWAEQRGLPVKQDKVGNLLVTIPASKGREKVAPVLLQGHVDMVCEKNAATRHDFARDPIKLKVAGKWVTADGTTLGADNGLGVAMALALADEPRVVHPTLEVLLTVDEERGLTGASNVEAGFFTARRMINLDSEEDASLFIGCAGGRDSEITVKNRKSKPAKGHVGRRIAVSGLQGGHSGLDIDKNRGNAIKILVRCLLAARDAIPGLKLASIDGGSMRNAIPREAQAVVSVPQARARELRKIVLAAAERIRSEELGGTDTGLAVKVSTVKLTHSLGGNCTTRTLALLDALPSGVLAMSPAVPGLVETSSNVGVVHTDGGKVGIVCCSRSSSMSALAGLVRRHRSLVELLGDRAVIDQPPGYPGWRPNPGSEMVRTTARLYKKLFRREPELKAIHAGLECGLLTERYPELDIVSFGPDIVGAHSPDEKVSVPSVQTVWKLLTAVLAELR